MSGSASDGADGSEGEREGGGGVDRRRLVRWLVGLAVGVPLLVEAVTFLGLLGSHAGGDGAPTTGSTTSESGDDVGVGGELLPATPQTDRVEDAYVRGGEQWRFVLVVRVVNDPAEGGSYRLELGEVHTDEGEVVEGGDATPDLAPGESATLVGRWDLPAGSNPSAVRVTGVVTPAEGDPRTESRLVPLAGVRVEKG
ncbi:MAG: hypothetical protein ABEJ04_01070 [Halobacteriaceae archaeon]